MSDIKQVEKIKTDLVDASQVKDALKLLENAKDDLPKLRDKLDKAVPSDAPSKIKSAESSVIDRAKKGEERVKKALEKLGPAQSDIAKAKDARSYVKDAVSELKQLDTYFYDLTKQVAAEASSAKASSKKAGDLMKKAESACASEKASRAQLQSAQKEHNASLGQLATELGKAKPTAAVIQSLVQQEKAKRSVLQIQSSRWRSGEAQCHASVNEAIAASEQGS
jgi:hypothetical protein